MRALPGLRLRQFVQLWTVSESLRVRLRLTAHDSNLTRRQAGFFCPLACLEQRPAAIRRLMGSAPAGCRLWPAQ